MASQNQNINNTTINFVCVIVISHQHKFQYPILSSLQVASPRSAPVDCGDVRWLINLELLRSPEAQLPPLSLLSSWLGAIIIHSILLIDDKI